MNEYKIQKFPHSRIATIDVYEIGKRKHHVSALIELDVTNSREKIKHYNNGRNNKISFTAWLISAISHTIKNYETASSYLIEKHKLIIFQDINVYILVEKKLNDEKVPIPLVIKKAHETSIDSITRQKVNVRNEQFTDQDIILNKKAGQLEKIYYFFPGVIRRYIWKFLMKHPKFAYKKMGNVAITSVGMIGKVNGWFIPSSVHPICFGVSSITKKPLVMDNKIEIREMLNMTILLDHDVIDGANMARFIKDLVKNIENGLSL